MTSLRPPCHSVWPLVVLLAGLAGSVTHSLHVHREAETQNHHGFGSTCNELKSRIIYILAGLLEQRARTGQCQGELTMVRGGTRFEADIASVLFQTQPVARTSMIICDITERRRVGLQLHEQLEELWRWHEATLGREGRILELKGEVNELLARVGTLARFPCARRGQEAGDV